MGKPASMIVTRTAVLWSRRSDSHKDILKEYNLCDFVRVEIVPPNHNYTLPFDQWVYKTDQDTVPDWYNPREAELAVRVELPAWAGNHIINQHRNKKPALIRDGDHRVVLRGKIKQLGGKCRIFGKTAIIQYGGICFAYDNTTIMQYGGKCYATDRVRIIHFGGKYFTCGEDIIFYNPGKSHSIINKIQ